MNYWEGRDNSLLLDIFRSPCNCVPKVKTSFILHRPPTLAQLRLIDDTPMGIKIIADKERNLGFNMASRLIGNPGTLRPVTRTDACMSDMTFEHFIQKVEQRGAKCHATEGPIHDKVSNWRAFTVGILLYPATQITITKGCLERIRTVQSNIYGATGWI